MSDKVINTTNDYRKAAEAADAIDFGRQFSLEDMDTLRRKLRQSYIQGYMAALATLENRSRANMNMGLPDDRAFSLQRGRGCWWLGSWSADMRSRRTVKAGSIPAGPSSQRRGDSRGS
jgi:hypothetical protein